MFNFFTFCFFIILSPLIFIIIFLIYKFIKQDKKNYYNYKEKIVINFNGFDYEAIKTETKYDITIQFKYVDHDNCIVIIKDV